MHTPINTPSGDSSAAARYRRYLRGGGELFIAVVGWESVVVVY